MSLSESRHEESFNNLPIYLHNLRRTNLRTYTHIRTDLMDRFKLYAFIGCFLPVIFISSVPLRGDYLKTMFVVVAIYGNNKTLPIAFALAVENNLYCCTWFLMRLREALR
uniref:Uncharacterized protein n=1 Tax=Lactuca sativa TaxID=4236 RepID=A0A9R1VX40_LACSA|nr:hypothetical protein LSAT_V11C400164950 [Lactuca sativa]